MRPSLLDHTHIRRAAFIGGHILLLAALGAFVLGPIRAGFAEGDAEIARQAETLARFQAIARHKPEPASPDQAALAAGLILTGPNEGVAAANLQARLKIMSEAAGARLRSVQGLPGRTEGAQRMIGARLEIFGPLQAVHRAIHAVESARPALILTATTLKLSPAAARPGTAAEPVMEAQLEISAAFQPGEAK
jgi:general secretion pathway protein M